MQRNNLFHIKSGQPAPPTQVNLVIHHPPPEATWAFDDEHEVGQLLAISHAEPTTITPTSTTSASTTSIIATITSPLYNTPLVSPIVLSPLNIPLSSAPAPLLVTPTIIDTTSPSLHHNLALWSRRMFHRMYPNASMSMPSQPTHNSNTNNNNNMSKK